MGAQSVPARSLQLSEIVVFSVLRVCLQHCVKNPYPKIEMSDPRGDEGGNGVGLGAQSAPKWGPELVDYKHVLVLFPARS